MKKFLTYTLLGVLLAGCAGGGREPLETVVDKALAGAERQQPLTMQLFVMVNWMFTWMRPDGCISHADMGRMAADLFIGGLDQVQLPTAQHAASATTLA